MREHALNVFDDRRAGADPAAHVEALTSGLTVTGPADVAAYQGSLPPAPGRAVTGAAAQALIRRLNGELAG
jgi:hypothetical protein